MNKDVEPNSGTEASPESHCVKVYRSVHAVDIFSVAALRNAKMLELPPGLRSEIGVTTTYIMFTSCIDGSQIFCVKQSPTAQLCSSTRSDSFLATVEYVLICLWHDGRIADCEPGGHSTIHIISFHDSKSNDGRNQSSMQTRVRCRKCHCAFFSFTKLVSPLRDKRRDR